VRRCDGARSQERSSVDISWGVFFPSDFHPRPLPPKLQRFCRLRRVNPPVLLVDTSGLHANRYPQAGTWRCRKQGVCHRMASPSMASLQVALGDKGQTEGGGALPTLNNVWDQASVAGMGVRANRDGPDTGLEAAEGAAEDG
jgi:hypothetical protein